MKKTYILISLTILGMIFILAGCVLQIVDSINEYRCYNMPLNEFYKDKQCLKYKEQLLKIKEDGNAKP